MKPTTELYFESHITIEPVLDSLELDRVGTVAKEHKFRVADLLMKKRNSDTLERSVYDSFMTTRGTDFHDVENRTINCIIDLERAGFKVWRYKIENTLVDVKFNKE